MSDTRAKPAAIKAYFGNVTLQELKALKEVPADYDAIAEGIGDGSLTY